MQQMGGQQMGNMSPGMMHPGPPGAMNMAQMQYRQTMHNLHKSSIPPGALNSMLPGGGAGSPPSDGQQFNPDGPQSRPGTGMPGGMQGVQGHFPPHMGGPGNPNPGNRSQPGQPPNKPMGGMMPPPSPGMKHTPGPDKGPNQGENPNASPRNMGMGQPQSQGMPPNPSHQPQQSQQQQQQQPQQQQQHGGTAPPTPIPTNSITAPSPPPMMNALGGGNHGPTTQDLFGVDFINSVSNSLEDFEFRPDATMDFERDFGEWFHDSGGLEGKGL